MTSIIDSEDAFLWPDGTWCYRHQLAEMAHMSDDFEVVPFGCRKWIGLTDGVPY